MTKKKTSKGKNKNPGVTENLVSNAAESPNNKQENSEIIEKLISEAEKCMDEFNYSAAQACCERLLQLDPENLVGMEMLAGIYVESGNWKDAEKLLLQCVNLSPSQGHTKYFALGQLYEGKKSVDLYRQGISIVEKLLEKGNAELGQASENTSSLKRVLSDAYCSIGELYMTDCCYEDDAEQMCRTSIEKGIEADPTNSEAYQCLAHFHLVKEEFEEAKSMIQKSLSLWLPQHEDLRDGKELDQLSELSIPLMDSRIKASKLLIELEMFDEAIKVLDGLIETDDEITEVWYLLGWLNYLRGDDYKGNARYYFKKAKEVATKTGVADPDQLNHIEELLNELAGYATDEDDDPKEGVDNLENGDLSLSEEESHGMET